MKRTPIEAIVCDVERYYSDKIEKFGATARGVDWNSRESQELRFEQLLKVTGAPTQISINDYGCGYGALVNYLRSQGYDFQYVGFDISKKMIAEAQRIHAGSKECSFVTDESELSVRDYTIVSGVFNVKLQTDTAAWEEYVVTTVHKIARLSRKGFSFNVLTKYADRDMMRDDLYYADPLKMFDYCKRTFSRYVALLHDYPLYEFTIVVRY